MQRTAETIYDEWLVLRSQDGEAAALAELVTRWQPRLLRHGRRLTGEADGAAEAVQEAWLAIVRGLRRLDDPARFPAWAFRITTFKCADWIRARARERARRGPQTALADAAAPPESAPAAAVEGIHEALWMLSREHQTALWLHYHEGLSVDEVAQALAVPPGTVKSRLHYARAQLKAALERSRR